ncbi:hypothetical protein DM02DRAFT_349305 [Periconia macrospinosa]|uniref:Heterokaryon incompatibility domain-containing protein n=1 Tax=Periconia macrospinosa TaxID=97972 RepID=A0A2V1D023_9PLEO|nr:hypothetical protein DM02DRAFT_349305 [Periconia macrospinosa]
MYNTQSKAILVDRQPVFGLRLNDRDRYLWIDVICINQADKEEQSRELQSLEVEVLVVFPGTVGFPARREGR